MHGSKPIHEVQQQPRDRVFGAPQAEDQVQDGTSESQNQHHGAARYEIRLNDVIKQHMVKFSFWVPFWKNMFFPKGWQNTPQEMVEIEKK